MIDSFRGFRCWTAARVQDSVFGDIASLDLDADPVFLAAHTSLDIRHLKGANISTDTPEQAVLRALTDSLGLPSTNTVIAITGRSGSGKSHLVRWLRAHLSGQDPRYHLIYVPRELATVRELIGRVLDGLPPSPEADAVRDELEKAFARKPPDQLAEELLDRVRSVVAYELPNASESDASGLRILLLGARAIGTSARRRENGLADLLLVRPVRDHLLRPEGGLARIIDSLRGQRTGRDEELPEFTVEDMRPRRQAVDGQIGGDLRAVWTAVQRTPEAASALLNDALPRAVAEVSGMREGTNLAEVFAQSRQQLRSQGKDLVLLFEDLAQFGLFDGELFDQFVLQPGATLAPIRAVFAITDGKFDENVPDTVQTRLAHRFEVSGIHPGSEESAVTPLLGRYLNVARVGRERLLEAWQAASESDRESGTWVPNACRDFEGRGECPHRETCWPAFGRSGEFGLYPYDDIAVRRAVKGSSERVTPRVVVDAFVHDFLLQADAEIGDEEFPSESVRDRFDFWIAMPKEAIVPASDLSEDDRERLHRARVIWADGGVEPSGITEAFALPKVTGVTLTTEEKSPVSESDTAEKPRDQPLTSLFAWENGEPLPERDATFYRQSLYDLTTSRVDLNALLIDGRAVPALSLFRRVVRANSFEFTPADPGRRAGPDQLHFIVPPTDSGVRLLSAVRWFIDHGHWDVRDRSRKWDFVGDAARSQLELEEFIDSCGREIDEALTSCLKRGPFEPATAVVALRALALRALGYDFSDGPEALNFVLTEIGLGSPDPSDRWSDVYNEARSVLARVGQSWIEAFAAARQGDTGNPQAIDVARLLPVLATARQDPSALIAKQTAFDEAFGDLQKHWDALSTALLDAADEEASSLRRTATDVLAAFQGLKLDEVWSTVESVGRMAANNGLFRPLDQYAAFGTACDRLKTIGEEDVRSWERGAQELADGDDAVGVALNAQQWSATARAALNNVGLVVECLEATSAELSDRLAAEVGETPEQMWDQIHQRLSELSETLEVVGAAT